MKTKEIKLYSFQELAPELQEKLIEDNRDCLVTYSDWHDPILEGFCEDMDMLGHSIDAHDISYSGFWSQGDGLSFTTKNGSLSVGALLKEMGIKMKDMPRGFSKELKDGEFSVELIRTSHHYSHHNTVDVTLDYSGELEKVAEAFFALEDDIISFLRDKMDELYASLEKYHDELTSDEVVKDELIERENDYLIDGNIFSFDMED